MSEAKGRPMAHGAPVLSATLRRLAEDFVVEEIDAFTASGDGEHALLTVRKRGLNTAFVARRIAQWAGVAEVAVGYAGLKDRHAVTTQRFSVHLPGKPTPPLEALAFDDAASGESLVVMDATRHARKLPKGALAGNRFVLTLRDVEGDRAAIATRLAEIAARGVPNYFGEQRFGRSGDNVAQALAMFAGRRIKREQRALLLSAARSELFNRVLSHRVDAGAWDAPLEGEAWMLDGSRSVFGPEPWNDVLSQRLADFDIHPTAPLWGEGELRSTGTCAALERKVVSLGDGPALARGLEAARLRQERRATRLRPQALSWDLPGDASLRLSFSLPAGAYATTVLAELGMVVDVQKAGSGRSSE
ncbi:tRNA pseudouridine(13) synthase TruD [Luteimonas aestuarii]|uniref:tRNA pseudouridine synthase D n=1 Tax=Luteimonas aestuarii TaxID=453837 RepID=A0A4R5TVM0_9GAMM|nr:tRNA pseudouridine(13) synthase TruD [Luteimonas aestuarii]TDK25143.1 tRNA pseudouridine(13) synthase TruD [Luteimonas aestuarii]